MLELLCKYLSFTQSLCRHNIKHSSPNTVSTKVLESQPSPNHRL